MALSAKTSATNPNLIPPKEMLFDGSSSLEEFVQFGENFCDGILIARAQLQPSAAVLDLGCGNGQIARPLTRLLSPIGRYEGIDVNGSSIAWLQKHYDAYPNFHFTHIDVYNKIYNPDGRLSPAQYRLPFADDIFDCVVLKSVFTHMLPDGVYEYLREISRVLRRGGQSVITYFLLNEESLRFVDLGLSVHKLTFEYAGDPLCRIANSQLPEAVVGHDERRIREYYAATGCTLADIGFGTWCGRQSPLGHQDLVIAAKDGAVPAGRGGGSVSPAPGGEPTQNTPEARTGRPWWAFWRA
jgi:SAM-dependent methyltransferase